MLDDLTDYKTVEEAAKHAAGNWKNWHSFAWFGAKEVPEPHNVMLGYTLGHEPSITQIANHKVIQKELDPYMGDIRQDALVENYGAVAHGDMRLKGFMVRVYKDGKITEPFQKLYRLSRRYKRNNILDQKVWDETNEDELYRYVYQEVAALCRQDEYKHIQFTDQLVAEVLDIMNETENVEYDWINFDDIEKAFKEHNVNASQNQENGC